MGAEAAGQRDWRARYPAWLVIMLVAPLRTRRTQPALQITDPAATRSQAPERCVPCRGFAGEYHRMRTGRFSGG